MPEQRPRPSGTCGGLRFYLGQAGKDGRQAGNSHPRTRPLTTGLNCGWGVWGLRSEVPAPRGEHPFGASLAVFPMTWSHGICTTSHGVTPADLSKALYGLKLQITQGNLQSKPRVEALLLPLNYWKILGTWRSPILPAGCEACGCACQCLPGDRGQETWSGPSPGRGDRVVTYPVPFWGHGKLVIRVQMTRRTRDSPQ